MYTDANNEYWLKFSRLINADFEGRTYWHSAKCIYSYRGLPVIFDNYTHYTVSGSLSMESFVTRIYCTFKCDSEMAFKISKPKFFEKLFNRVFLSEPHTKTVEEQYVITANSHFLLELIPSQMTRQMNDLQLQNLSIDKNLGIWGDVLPENEFCLSTWIDGKHPDHSILMRTKVLFESIIDKLQVHFNISSGAGGD